MDSSHLPILLDQQSLVAPSRLPARKTWYIEPAEIQRDLDVFLRFYNIDRSHQGYRLKGRTPAQALREALNLEALPPVVPEVESQTPEAA